MGATYWDKDPEISRLLTHAKDLGANTEIPSFLGPAEAHKVHRLLKDRIGQKRDAKEKEKNLKNELEKRQQNESKIAQIVSDTTTSPEEKKYLLQGLGAASEPEPSKPQAPTQQAAPQAIPPVPAQVPRKTGGGGFGAIARDYRKTAAGVEERLGESRELSSASYDQQKAAIKEAAAVSEANATQLRKATEYENQKLAFHETESMGIWQEQSDAAKEQMEKVRRLNDDAANAKVDPNRFMSDWGNRAVASIAVALGSFGSGLTGGRNDALGVINSAIDRDIQSQVEEANALKGKASSAENMYQFMREQFGDDKRARLGMRSFLIESKKRKLEELSQGFKSDEQRTRAAELVAQLDAEQAKSMQEFEQQTLDNARAEATFRTQNLSAQRMSEAQSAQGGQDGSKSLPPSVLQKIGGYNAAENMLANLDKDWGEKTGLLSGVMQYFPGTDATKYNDRRAIAAQVIGSILEGGKLTGEDYGRYYNMMPSPADSEERKQGKLQALADNIRLAKESETEALGSGGYNVGASGGQLRSMGPAVR